MVGSGVVCGSRLIVVDSETGRNKTCSLSGSFIAVDSAIGGCKSGSTLFALPGLVEGKLLDGLLTGLVANGVLLVVRMILVPGSDASVHSGFRTGSACTAIGPMDRLYEWSWAMGAED